MSKHTPGPWSASRILTTKGPSWDVFGPAGQFICRVTEETGDGEEDASNARLIAAAPMMYAALTLLLQSHDLTCEGERCQLFGVDIARYAIAKAEGRE